MVRPGASTFDPAALVALASVAGIALAVCLVKRLPVGESQVTMLAYFRLVSLAITVVPAAIWWTTPTATQWLLLARLGGLRAPYHAIILRSLRSGGPCIGSPFSLRLLSTPRCNGVGSL